MKKYYAFIATRKLFPVFFISGLSLFLLPAFSQQNTSLFVVVDFMKVKPENHSQYLEVEQEIWKPMHQERIRQGIIIGWYLYAVEFSGTDDEYNYVTISLYDNVEHLENPWKPEIPQKIHRDITLQNIMEKTHRARENVKSELFYSIATAPPIPLEVPATYLQMNYMQVEPGMQSNYEQLESEIWLPIHTESIQSGRTIGWGLWKTLFPRGSGEKYQYIAFNSFSEFSYIFELDFSVPFKKVHPAKDFGEIIQETLQTRTITRTELWDLIDYAIR